VILPRDALIAPTFREKAQALSSDEQAVLAELVWDILQLPTDGDVGEPCETNGGGFVVLYEIDENLIAQVTTFRRTHGYPTRM